jgi:diguanylate cyclase (GGDEF)-like protein
MTGFLGKDSPAKLAEKYVQQGKYSAAADEYRKLLVSQPNDVTLLNTIGDLCARAGRTKEAVQHFRRVAQTYEDDGQTVKAIAMYKKIAKVDPADPEAALKLAELYCRQGLRGDAWRQAAAIARAVRSTEYAQQALRLMRKVIELEPQNVGLQLELAASLQVYGYSDEAQAMYVRAGQELARQGRAEESLEALQKALALKPESKRALKAAADTLAQQGNADAAVRMLRDQIAKAPTDTELLVILGRVYLNAEQLDEAEATFDRLFQLDAGFYEYLLGVGRCFIEVGKHDRAVAVIDRCLDAAFARNGRAKVVTLLDEVLRRDEDNVDALKRLAFVHTRSGDSRALTSVLTRLADAAARQDLTDDAREANARLAELDPHGAFFRERLETLPSPIVEDLPPTPTPPVEKEAPPPRAAAAPAGERSRTSLEPHELFHSYATYTNELEIVEVGTAAPAESLEELEAWVEQHPDNFEGRLRLKQSYIESGQREKAAAQCLALARIYEERGEMGRARELVSEAYRLNRGVRPSRSAEDLEPVRTPKAASPPNVANLRQFDRDYEREWRRASRDGRSLALLKIMVDRYEDYIEMYGQLGGDYSLERVSAALEHTLMRPGDVLSTCGGGAFLAILPETDDKGARTVAERIRVEVEALHIPYEFTRMGEWVTVSIGVASVVPRRNASSGALIAAVDEALLQAKVSGGNRIAVASVLGVPAA